jgi:pimeloyl-ACP methyl ester carboxylesterase
MILVGVVATLAILVAITQVGVVVLERTHPRQGNTVDVPGASFNVVDIGRRDAAGPPIVMIHGASANLESMRQPVGNILAKTHRVILLDRPGHGWSSRDDLENGTPAIQAKQIDAVLEKLGVRGAILVVHSLAGALGPLMALDYPQRVAGAVMLAPVLYPWRGGVGWINDVATMPVIGPLFANTIVLPLGLLFAEPGARSVFWPQTMPEGFVKNSATLLLLRPREFRANAWDLVTLKTAVTEQAPRYPQIKAPMVTIHGDKDATVSLEIHSRPFVAVVPNAKLIVLPGVGHMVQNVMPDVVVREIEAMAKKIGSSKASAAAK